MPIETSEVESVTQRAIALGLTPPEDLALIPRNFFEAASVADLVHEAHAATIRKLWRGAGLHETALEPSGVALPRMLERSAEWIGPTIFVGSLLATQNPSAVSLAIGVVANYATAMLRGQIGGSKVRLDVIVETTRGGSCRRVSYSGDVEGLAQLPDIVREAVNNQGRS